MKRWFAWLLLLGLLMPAVGFAEIGDAIKAEIAEMELEDIEALLPLLYERMVELSSDIMVPELLLSEEEDTGVRANPARDAIRIVDHAYCEDDNVVIVLENTSEKTVPFFFVQIQYIDGKDEIVHTGRHLHWTILPGHQVVTIYSLWKSDYHDALTLNVSIEVDHDEAVYRNFEDNLVITQYEEQDNVSIHVQNLSEERLDELSVAVVYYYQGKIVGGSEDTARNVMPEATVVLECRYPTKKENDAIAFDDYIVFINLSHVWKT